MKKNLMISLVCVMASLAGAQLATNSYSLLPNTGIADGNAVGLMETFNVNGLGGTITNIRVSLDISGGFNGDLYAYLAGPQGQFAVLLNRVGLTGSNPVGYGNPGFFNITLDDSGANANVHGYQNGNVNLSGTLTGTWGSDGRNINPQSSGTVFDAASTLANLGVFNGGNANGLWTFFIADLSAGGGVANLNSVVLTITTVPEPQSWAMLVGGFTLLLLAGKARRKNALPSCLAQFAFALLSWHRLMLL